MALLLVCAGTAHAQPEVAVNDFACALYVQLAAENANLFFSPFSISSALAMTAEGARGETAQQMARVLGLAVSAQHGAAQPPYDWSPLHAELAQLAARLTPQPPAPALLAELTAARAELDRVNSRVADATTFDDDYYDLGKQAQSLADQVNRLQLQIDPTEFRSANALWLADSFTLEQSFVDAIAQHYDSGGARRLDFRGDSEGSRNTINDWVEDQTHGRIHELLARGVVDERTRLVLTNAVYFLGQWLQPFETARTQRAAFRLREGGSVQVELMQARKTKSVRYAAFDADGSPFATPLQVDARSSDTSGRYPERGFQMVELPYRGDKLVMQLILPLGGVGLDAVEAKLSAAHLRDWNAALQSRNVDVALPKFSMDSSVELSPMLKTLGMQRAFANPADPDGAQFDGLSVSSDPSQGLFISLVVHKAFVQVDEKGTEAAAATAVVAMPGSAMPTRVDFTPVFRADHPFLFLIREQHSGTVLFFGRLARPEAG